MNPILFALCLTLILEVPFSFLFKGKKAVGLFVAFLTNAITNPVFNALYIYAFGYSRLFFYLGELAVILLEGAVYSLYSRSRWGLVISIAANLLSAVIGFILNQLSPPMDIALIFGAATLLIELPIIFIVALRIDKKRLAAYKR